MELRKTADGNSFIIEVIREKDKKSNIFSRIMFVILGICGLIVSAALAITLIGLIVAIPLFGTSIAFITGGLSKQVIACPNCDYKQRVTKDDGQYTCAKCRKLTLIEWIK
ncbi:hypothetical protein [Priestia taiwanensis]|uniref:Uncharacterized protein n=1 Tax=Priestia taiwanensis TaxID=1347902 RepID=A0A917AN33_9BACI|nr:hypothetical protein [Priestia taiwanensis]MBM7362424.1 methyl coenzyme M reductase subunit C-like uncharacterized protein (methanogenesis marker protein 7) [Priestia taiwanensis]GGE62125.1 hypothetical protein GCM10007140_10480 [Priestia taiwanensis]